MSGRAKLWDEELHDDRLEWELEEYPGKILDEWREAARLFESVATLAEYSPNNAYIVAVFDTQSRIRSEVGFWEEEVAMRLERNIRKGALTEFGKVLKPLMERAGVNHDELLRRTGKYAKPDARETLLRLMYGPVTTDIGGYLAGFDDALKIEDEAEKKALSRALWNTTCPNERAKIGGVAEPENGGRASA